MPLRLPYRPVHYGHYYFAPYNYTHVLAARELAPLLKSDPIAPYETPVFENVYKAVLPVGLPPVPRIEDEDTGLPNIENLLKAGGEKKAKPSKTPPAPGLKKTSAPAKKKAESKPKPESDDGAGFESDDEFSAFPRSQ
jgi:hypothetical protein